MITWEENENGTIRYTATNLEEVEGSREMISLDFLYGGRRTSPDAEGFKEHSCLANFSADGWIYYTTMEGTFTSNQSGVHTVSRRGQAFQIGNGANATSRTLDFGASGWFSATGDKWTRGAVSYTHLTLPTKA